MDKQAWHDFLNLCKNSNTTKELEQILNFFLTIDEKENIVDRFRITKALLSGELTQREMSEKLNVSIAKITRGSNAIKAIDESLKELLRQGS